MLYGAATQGVAVPYEPFVEAFQTLADATPETIWPFLTEADKQDLVSFLKALSGEGWQQVKPPQIFPQ